MKIPSCFHQCMRPFGIMFVFTRKPLIVIESMPVSKTFNQLTSLFGQETFVVIRTNASKMLERSLFWICGAKGENLLFLFGQWSGDPKGEG
mgnify:CR=1 FL=1